MSKPGISDHAKEMLDIFYQHRPHEHFAGLDQLSIAEAYQVQNAFIAGRVSRGARVIGWKVGCTSAAIRQQFGLCQPISGKLLEPDLFPDGVTRPASAYIECAVEPELVFRLGSDLQGEVDEKTLITRITAVSPGIELHNYRFWFGKPTSQELIASNGIHAGLVCGQELPVPRNWDIDSEEVSILVNGEIRASAKCSEIMGGPLRSLQWLARHAATTGQRLEAGQLVIPGSAVPLIRVQAGDSVEARFATLGSCHMSMA